jgi:hypothetical protein
MDLLSALAADPSDLPFLLAGWFLVLNAAAFALVGIDRARASVRGQRLSEPVLLWIATIGGWPGLLTGLGRAPGPRYNYTFRGWLRGAIAAQALLGGLLVMPQGSVILATERLVAFVLQDARAAERRANVGRVVLDSDRDGSTLMNVVPLRTDPC